MIRKINLNKRSEEIRLKLARQLYKMNQQVFDNVSFEDFHRRVTGSGATNNLLYIYYNDNNIIGFYSIQAHKRILQNKKSIVIRMQAAFLPQYRNANSKLHLSGMMALLKLYFTNLNRRYYIFATLIHPASYLGLTRYLRVWPNYLYNTPKEIEQLILQLLNESGYQVQEKEGQPHIIDTGWQLIEEQKIFNYHQPKPDLEFFTRHNPHYLQGKGLVVLSQVQPIHVAKGVYKMMKFKYWDRNQYLKTALARMLPLPKNSKIKNDEINKSA